MGPLGRLDRGVRQGGGSGTSEELKAPEGTFRWLQASQLTRADVAVIAEVKRRSPSKGVINALTASAQASAYERGGASALSILTEPTEFGGSLQDLRDARAATSLPTLKKDFHVHPIQMLEARAAGASAVLLIARALPSDRLRAMADRASELSLGSGRSAERRRAGGGGRNPRCGHRGIAVISRRW
jgi:indole-3-glycerol phosphate synthase